MPSFFGRFHWSRTSRPRVRRSSGLGWVELEPRRILAVGVAALPVAEIAPATGGDLASGGDSGVAFGSATPGAASGADPAPPAPPSPAPSPDPLPPPDQDPNPVTIPPLLGDISW